MCTQGGSASAVVHEVTAPSPSADAAVHTVEILYYKMTRKRPVVRVTVTRPSYSLQTCNSTLPSGQYKDLLVRRPFMLGDFAPFQVGVSIHVSCLLPDTRPGESLSRSSRNSSHSRAQLHVPSRPARVSIDSATDASRPWQGAIAGRPAGPSRLVSGVAYESLSRSLPRVFEPISPVAG